MSIQLSQAQPMTKSALFSLGIEQASFMISSGLLQKSWDVIKTSHEGIVTTVGEGLLSWNVYQEPYSTLSIIAFEYPCTKEAPLVSFNNTAISLLRENYIQLSESSKMTSSTRLIVTGLGFGGFVASLFTTFLLDSIPLRQNNLFCITFGSPLLGNKRLQQDLSDWNFCFFHVVSLEDPLPRLSLANHSSETSVYMPSGTFLFCSDVNSTCFENPESVLEILKAIGPIHVHNQGFQYADYGKILENLNSKTICEDLTTMPENMQQQNVDMNTLTKRMEILEQKFIYQRRQKAIFNSYIKLSSIKIHMAKLEWYKKEQRKGGYYDNYKNLDSATNLDVITCVHDLTNYWKNLVEEARIKPKKRAANLRWLFSGTICRRMVEPLVIAEWYRNGGKDYLTNRPKHFVLLEEWYRIEMTEVKTRNMEDSLDSNQHWDLYWDEDEDGYWDKDYYYRTVDECLVSRQGSKVDEEESTWEDKINSLIRSDDENVPVAISSPMPSTTTSNNNKEACIDVPITDIDLIRTRKRNVQYIWTSDSCFWAHVEEARISCKTLKVWLLVEEIRISRKELFDLAMEEKEETLQKLVEFEEYVYELLKNYDVSPDIFLPKSSYMLWWNEYKAIKGTSYDSKLTSFMNHERNYEQYALGDYDFL